MKSSVCIAKLLLFIGLERKNTRAHELYLGLITHFVKTV